MSSAKLRKNYVVKRQGVVKAARIKNPNYGTTSAELYLGMIENKDKVIKSKKFVEYVAPTVSLDVGGVDDYQYSEEDGDDDISVSGSLNGLKRGIDYDDDDDDDYDIDDTRHKRIRTDETIDDNYRERRLIELNKKDDINTHDTPRPLHPPSLANIREKYASLESEKDEEKQKVIAQFSMIAKMYPNEKIPHVTMSTDLAFMKNEYETIIRNLRIDGNHQKYKQMLTIGFYVVEYCLGKFFKLKMGGFANEQIRNMDRYDRLLIEIGHKNYIPNAPERFPVEVRLLGMVLIQTVFFLVVKQVSFGAKDATAAGGLFGFVSSLMNPSSSTKMDSDMPHETNTQTETTSSTTEQKSKMSGPKPNVE
jgi:hypothetical protein